jgi:peptidoglycan hydrolase-like protein with peptidoglycan-binding domain
MRTWRRIGTVLAVVAALFAAGLVSATPAQAAPYSFEAPGTSQNWNVFPTLCNGCSSGPVVRFWQMILYADYGNNIGQSCSTFVDGVFGPNTTYWTKVWQQARGIGVDGVVGPQTWGKAQQQRVFINYQAFVSHWRYDGSQRDFHTSSIVTGTSTAWNFNTCTWL